MHSTQLKNAREIGHQTCYGGSPSAVSARMLSLPFFEN
jgi:hypothetical protein